MGAHPLSFKVGADSGLQTIESSFWVPDDDPLNHDPLNLDPAQLLTPGWPCSSRQARKIFALVPTLTVAGLLAFSVGGFLIDATWAVLGVLLATGRTETVATTSRATSDLELSGRSGAEFDVAVEASL